jgi:hypothetical protein
MASFKKTVNKYQGYLEVIHKRQVSGTNVADHLIMANDMFKRLNKDVSGGKRCLQKVNRT